MGLPRGRHRRQHGVPVARAARAPERNARSTRSTTCRPMLWVIGGAIVASIVGRILVEIVSPSESTRGDIRDKEIDRLGERVGSSFVVIGALGALVLAMLDADGLLDRERRSTSASCSRRSCRASRSSSPTAGACRRGEADEGHERHPCAALPGRRDDPGRARRTPRRDPPDRHRHRAGPLLALARDGVPDRPGLRGPARRRVPVPRTEQGGGS